MIKLCTKFEIPTFTHCEDMKGVVWGGTPAEIEFGAFCLKI